MNDNMKYTRDLLDSQERVLVQVIRFLDSSGHSEQPIRDLVDTVLNHMKTAKQLSREELDEAENAKA
jgi:hypothetical protein|tara:strand:+ start:893 stop:1093 length:201 start_codon:yes stop_codon:yes gene_type:complete